MGRKHWEKEKLLVTSNFSFSHSVFKRLDLQAHKNQGLFGKGLKKLFKIVAIMNESINITEYGMPDHKDASSPALCHVAHINEPVLIFL